MSIWENGSSFHWTAFERASDISPWNHNGTYLRYGRDAFGLLLKQGMEYFGWKRFWVPSYYCPEVIDYFVSTGIEVKIYPKFMMQCNELPKLSKFKQGDVVLINNYFGIDFGITTDVDYCDDVVIIEDHSHDPWSSWAYSSNADWCVASLRKVLPVADGAVVWSPNGKELPADSLIPKSYTLPVLCKLSGMLLKQRYLEGDSVEKEQFLELFRLSEVGICPEKIVGISEISKSRLTQFPIQGWREQRRRNYDTLSDLLEDCQPITVLKRGATKPVLDYCPFAVIIHVASDELQSHLHSYLISKNVYPAVLWQVDQISLQQPSEDNLRFSKNMLAIHCDGRYGIEDMAHISDCIHACFR